MARPRKGSLYWTKSGWRARLTIDVDGVAVQESFDPETLDRAAAASVAVAEYLTEWLTRTSDGKEGRDVEGPR